METITPIYLLDGQQSERLRFRMLDISDFDTWMSFCNDPDSGKYVGLADFTNPEDACTAWFQRSLSRYDDARGGMNVLVDKATNEFVGQCGLLVQTVDGIDELEIGYSLMPAHRGKGYAIEAAKKCRDFAFENNFSQTLISIIHPDNINSQKVALNNGMTLEKRTTFKDSPANIFRITRDVWLGK